MSLGILFVDDEPNVLDGLRRTLRVFRHEWEMRFAPGGAAALAALAEKPADVVVSDMRMPGMDGDEFLARVRQRHPQAVRIVLTGECTRDALLRVTPHAHRILTKPCDPNELKSAIRQSSSLHGTTMCPRLSAAVGRLRSVPSQSDFCGRILSMLADPGHSPADLAALCAQDVGMSAKLIQLSNSAMYCGAPRATQPLDAVRRLGGELTKAVVLSEGILSAFDPRSILPFTIDDVWPHSLAVGALAARIARAEADGEGWLNLVPTAGMLHDIGRLVLASTVPDSYVAALRLVEEHGIRISAAEREVFGVTHAEIGAYLLGLWGVPSALVESVAWHHTPPPRTPGRTDRFNLVTAVHAADAILGADEGEPDLEYLARLGLAERLPVWAALAEDLAPAGVFP